MIKPFKGAKLHIFQQYKSPVLNLVISGLPKEKWQFYAMFNGYLFPVNNITEDDVKRDGGRSDFYYIISGKFLFTTVETKDMHKVPPIKNFGKYPMFQTTLDYLGEEFTVSVKKFFKVKNISKVIPGAFMAHYISNAMSNNLFARGAKPEELIENLKSEIEKSKKPIRVTKEKLEENLMTFYNKPIMVWCSFVSRYDENDLPTYDSMIEDFSNVKVSIEDASMNNFSTEKFVVKIKIPPTYIEEYRSLMCDVEIALFPDIQYRKCIIVRDTTREDVAYNKMMEKMIIPEKTHEKTGKKYLEATYGDIFELGEIFSLGESFDISSRLRWLE